MNEHIAAVVVTYQPDLDALDELLDSIINQVHTVLVVDNGSGLDDFSSRYLDPRVRFLSTGFNKGIAAAQNLGITLARQLNANLVLFFDQDKADNDGKLNGEGIRAAFETFNNLDIGFGVAPVTWTATDHRPTSFVNIYQIKGGKFTKVQTIDMKAKFPNDWPKWIGY